MPISVECDVCGRQYKLADSLAGKAFTCKDCGAGIDVPGGRKSRRSDPDLDEAEEVISRKPPKSSAVMRTQSGGGGGRRRNKRADAAQMQQLAVGGGVLLVVIVLGVIFGGGGHQGPSLAPPVQTSPPDVTPMPPVTNTTPVPVTTPAVATTPSSTSPTNTPATTTTTPVQTPTASTTPTTTATTPAGNATTNPPADTEPPKTSPLYTFTVDGSWSVTADPPAEPLPTEWTADWKIPLTGPSTISFPATLSPLIIAGGETARSPRDLWNLATGSKLATLTGAAASAPGPLALSPDGRLVAWLNARKVSIYDVTAKKLLGDLQPGFGTTQFALNRIDLPTATRIVGQSTSGRALQAWSLPDGQVLHVTPLGEAFRDVRISAYSPGGRYVALESDAVEHTIQIYEIDSGRIVGRIVASKVKFGGELLPMAFSPNGDRLATAYESASSDGVTQLVIWNTTEGTRAAEHLLTPPIGSRLKTTSQSTGVQWFADGRKLLVHGVAMIDAESGDVLYQFPEPLVAAAPLRRPVGSNAVVEVSGDTRSATLQPLVVTDDELQRAAQLATIGGLPIDLKLPPLTSAEGIAPTAAPPNADWRLPPVSAAPPLTVLSEPLPLKNSSGTLRGLTVVPTSPPLGFFKLSEGENIDAAFARPQDVRTRLNAAGQVRNSFRPMFITAATNSIDIYDLSTRQFLRKLPIPFSCELLSVSPDGTRVAVQPHESQGRIDILDAADGRPVVAFRPYRSLSDPRDWDVTKVVLLDAAHVATLNDFDRFAVWELPACRAVFSVEQAWNFAVSPDRQTVAIATEAGIDLRAAVTGESLGVVPTKGVATTLVFHPQGERLAAIVQGPAGASMLVVNLTSGQPQSAVPLPNGGDQALRWVSDQHVLLQRSLGALGTEQQLIDATTGATLWRYGLKEGTIATGPVADLRLWYAAPSAGKPPVMNVLAVTLPDAAARKAIDAESSLTERPLQPGDKVAIRVNVTPIPTRPQLENELLSSLTKALERSGLVRASSAPIELHASAEARHGKSANVRNRDTSESALVRELTVTVQLAYKRGSQTLWQRSTEFASPTGPDRTVEGNDPQGYADREVWDRMTAYLKTLELPTQVLSPKATRGLGASMLGPAGPVVDLER
jgi:hypothetical protein